MTVRIPYIVILFAAAEAACCAVGAVIGLAVVLVRMAGERHGQTTA